MSEHVTREADMNTAEAGGCPVHAGKLSHPTEGGGNVDWWPNQLNLRILRAHTSVSDPTDEGFDYAKEFKTLDYEKIYAKMTKPAFVFDGRNILDHTKLRELGFVVYALGKPLDPFLQRAYN